MNWRFTKRVGIFYKDADWANKIFDEITKDIPPSFVTYRRILKEKRLCVLEDGGYIETINAATMGRTKRVELAIIQDGLDEELQKEIWLRVHHPFDQRIIKDVEELKEMERL